MIFLAFPLFEWNNFYQSTLLNCLTPFTAFVDCIFHQIFIIIDYLAFFGFPSSSISRDELLTFINMINDDMKEEDTELLNTTFGETKSHIIHLPDVIRIIRKINRPFEPLIKFRKCCQENLLGIKTCELIQFRLDNLEAIESYRISHNGVFPSVSCCSKDYFKYHKNPYKFDFEPTMNDSDLSLFSLINTFKQDFYGRRRSHPSIKRVISDGESYTNMGFGNIGYNHKKSACSNRSSARSVIMSARVIQVANPLVKAPSSSVPTPAAPYQLNNNDGNGYMMISSSTTPNPKYNGNTSLYAAKSNNISNSRKSPSQAFIIKSPKSPTLSGSGTDNKVTNSSTEQAPAVLKLTTTDHTS